MTYDQWKTTDPNDRDHDYPEEPTELEALYDQLRAAQESEKFTEMNAKARIAELTAALEEALAYFKNRYDVVDGYYGKPEPNLEMRLGTTIDETLYGIRF